MRLAAMGSADCQGSMEAFGVDLGAGARPELAGGRGPGRDANLVHKDLGGGGGFSHL